MYVYVYVFEICIFDICTYMYIYLLNICTKYMYFTKFLENSEIFQRILGIFCPEIRKYFFKIQKSHVLENIGTKYMYFGFSTF